MRKRHVWILFAVGVLAAVLAAPRAMGQTSTTGVVAGVVADPSGAVVPKAGVELTNMETNSVARQVSNDSGQFVFAGLAPGNYKITVKTAGFRTASIPYLVVEVNKSVNVTVNMEVGAAAEVVEVTADGERAVADDGRTDWQHRADGRDPAPVRLCSATPPS